MNFTIYAIDTNNNVRQNSTLLVVTDNEFTSLVNATSRTILGYGSGNLSDNVRYNATIGAIQSNKDAAGITLNGTYQSQVFDLGTTQSFKNISWTAGAYYGEEIGVPYLENKKELKYDSAHISQELDFNSNLNSSIVHLFVISDEQGISNFSAGYENIIKPLSLVEEAISIQSMRMSFSLTTVAMPLIKLAALIPTSLSPVSLEATDATSTIATFGMVSSASPLLTQSIMEEATL
ncbi:hypothetical protein HYW20_00155 [Candidatus Woesearchaeota archaeon]|nr:hypothetical protein [Candidatus Woesearchaeota archaeon]